MRVFDKPIVLQRKDHAAKQWVSFQRLHAHVNVTAAGEYASSGAMRSGHSLTFTVRYNEALSCVAFSMQDFRIVWKGRFYRVTGYDDYNLMHAAVKLLGECSGGEPVDG